MARILMRLFCLHGSQALVPRGIEVLRPSAIMDVLRDLPGILNAYSQAHDPAARRFIAELVVILVEGGLACSPGTPGTFAAGAEKSLAVAPAAFHIFYDRSTGESIAFGSGDAGNQSVWPILMCACRNIVEGKRFPSNPLPTFLGTLPPSALGGDIQLNPLVASPSAGGRNDKPKVDYLWRSQSSRSSPHVRSTMKLWRG